MIKMGNQQSEGDACSANSHIDTDIGMPRIPLLLNRKQLTLTHRYRKSCNGTSIGTQVKVCNIETVIC